MPLPAYLDENFIYSDNLEKHEEHVKKVLRELAKHGLYLKPEKCEFHQKEVKYLELIIGTRGLEMDKKKIETINNWPTPKKLRDIRAFLGFVNFYRRFIKGYSEVIRPMTLLTKKDSRLSWGPEQQSTFAKLKKAFTATPIMAKVDFDRDTILETNASNFVSAGILSQLDDQGNLHPIAYFSKKHALA